VATRVNQAPPLRSEKLAVTLEDLLSGYYLSKGKLHEGQVPALGGGGKWLIDRLSCPVFAPTVAPLLAGAPVSQSLAAAHIAPRQLIATRNKNLVQLFVSCFAISINVLVHCSCCCP